MTIRARTFIAAAGAEPVHDACIVVRDGRISAVGEWHDIDPDGELITVDGVLVPGFVDAHSHLRGLPLDAHGIRPRQFEAWICSLGAATALDPQDEALLATAELLETGVTAVQGFVDASPQGSALAGAQGALAGVARTGIRALIVLGFADRALRRPEPPTGEWALVPPEEATLPTVRVRDVAAEWLDQVTAPTIELGIGPIGAHWVTDELLAAIAAAAGGSRVHTHLHESRLHRRWVSGAASPLDRLDAAGLLDARLSGAHGVHLTPVELARIARSGAALVHCPLSNDALGVGTAEPGAWRAQAIPTALGVDSQSPAAPDYFDVMRAALHRSRATAHPLTAEDVFDMATRGGARALGIADGGRLAVGSPADVIMLDTAHATVDGIVETATATAVREVWVAGHRVVTDGHSVTHARPARDRLVTQLDADRGARQRRAAALAPTVDLVERLAGAMP
jgi:cytosine/adenosine deaminase-related metal-dependent hydrolase